MRTRALLLVALAAACGPDEKPVPKTKSAAVTATAAINASPAVSDDPEPADAQARAEAVVHEPFNRNKTTRLVMRMTTIAGVTTSLAGSGSQMKAREEAIDATLARLGATVTETEVVIRLPGAILFDFDSAAIRPDAARALEDVAQVIRSYPGRPVRIDGHTDAIASDDYNRGLSERRAKSVAEWLAAHVERGRLTPAGLGESKPVATNDTAAGRQLNRRVEVVIARK